MTMLLSAAFSKAAILPDSLQDEIARELIEEIECEQKWNTSLDKSSGHIDNMALQAIREFESDQNP